MSTVKTNNAQIGQSLTATNNFTWYQPASPDGTVRLGVGNSGATTADVITVNNSGIASTTITAANGNTVEATSGPTSTQLAGQRNKIINGAMMIDQRNAGASVTPTANNQYLLDRWSTLQTVASKYSVQQNAGSITPPVGFKNYLGVTSLSAYSVSSGDYFTIQQPIEGLNASDLAWGTANAKSVTLSFWVYSSLTGAFGGAISNGNRTRSYPFSYSINSANTWTFVSITISGDTTGTWSTDSSVGMYVQFGLGVGSTYSGTAGSWAATSYVTVTGATSVVGTNGATFYITGVQLEKGATATPFENRLYGTEMMLCQRYCQQMTNNNNGPLGLGRGDAYFYTPVSLTASMRAAPSLTYSGTLYVSNYSSNVATINGVGGITYSGTNNYAAIMFTTTGSYTAGAYTLNANASLSLLTAEL